MYKPFNKVVPQRPGKWETAVYQAATSPLTESLPKPQTRIEQLAQEFVCGKEVSSSISKLKEINRCITVYESYAAYQEDPDSCTNGLPPLEINVEYGKKETALSTETESKNAPEDKVNSAPVVSADMERTPEQAQLMEQVEKAYKTEMHSVEQARELCNKVRAVLSTAVYKTLTNRDKSRIYFIFKQLLERKEQLEVQEAQKLQQKGYAGIGNMLRAPYYEDPAKDVRQEPQNAVDYLLGGQPAQDIWAERLDIIHNWDEEKASLLKEIYETRTLEELEQFREKIGSEVSSWTNVYILQPLEGCIKQKMNQLPKAAQ